MRAFDRLLILLTAAGIWAMAAMYYVTTYRDGPKAAIPPPHPSTMAVVNDQDRPLKVSGTVDATTRMNCIAKGKIVTQKPIVRLFGPDDWKPEKEWPVEFTLECK